MKVEEAYLDVLQNIELAVANEYRANPSLKDREVLDAIHVLIRRYAAEERRQNHLPSVHLATPSLGVFDSVKRICDWRLGRLESDRTGDLDMTGTISVGELLSCLKRIRGSVQRWTREGGSRGYLDFMTSFALPDIQATRDSRAFANRNHLTSSSITIRYGTTAGFLK